VTSRLGTGILISFFTVYQQVLVVLPTDTLYLYVWGPLPAELL